MVITVMEIDAVKNTTSSVNERSKEALILLAEMQELATNSQPIPPPTAEALYKLLVELKLLYTHESSKGGISSRFIKKLETEMRRS